MAAVDFINEGQVNFHLPAGQTKRYVFMSDDGPRFWNFSLLRKNNINVIVRPVVGGLLTNLDKCRGGFFYWNNNEVVVPVGFDQWNATSFLPVRTLVRGTVNTLAVPLSNQYWRHTYYVQRQGFYGSGIEVFLEADTGVELDTAGVPIGYFGLGTNGYAGVAGSAGVPVGIVEQNSNFEFVVSSSRGAEQPFCYATSKTQIFAGPGQMVQDWNDLVLVFRLPIYANKITRCRGVHFNTAATGEGGSSTGTDINFFGHPRVNTWIEFSSDIFPRVIERTFGGVGNLLSGDELLNHNFYDGRGKIHVGGVAGSYNGLWDYLGFSGLRTYGAGVLFAPFEQSQSYTFSEPNFNQVFLPGDTISCEIDMIDSHT